jgi:hypothetical protein
MTGFMNKSFFMLLFTLAINPTAFSQIKKGKRMAGATVASAFYNSGKSEYSFPPPTTGYTSNVSSFGISLTPSMGWFISDNTAVGATLTFSSSKYKTNDVSDANGNTFNKDNSARFNLGIGGFARNYFKTEGNLLPFGQFNLSFGTGSSSSDGFTFSGNDKYSYDGKSSGDFFLNGGLSVGFTKMLNANTGLDFFAGYNYAYNKNTYKKTTKVDLGNNGTVDLTSVSEPTQKYTNHGASIGIGFQVFLDRKKK